MANSLSRFLRGAASGAATGGGMSGFNPLITAGSALVGGLFGLFEDDPEEERRRRYESALKVLGEYEQKALRQVAAETQGARGAARSRGTMLARSLGRVNDAESYVRPAEESASLGRLAAITGVEKDVASKRLGIEMDYANRPIEPSSLDVLETLAAPALQYGLGQEFLKTKTEDVTYPTKAKSLFSLDIPSVSKRQVGELSRISMYN